MNPDHEQAEHRDELENHDRPWERPGAVRRDCEPHRGHLVYRIGVASVVFGTLSILGGFTGVLGLGFGVVGWVIACRDLRRMRAGLMDPQGIAETEDGRFHAVFGIILSLICGGGYGLLIMVVWVLFGKL